MSTQAMAIRFDKTLLEQVRRRARAQGTTMSTVVQTMVDEGLRMAEHPGVVFRDGPAAAPA
jgi:antitoxin component of RelBE/YafQ-DinJ toxin-antitoxin module